MTIKNVTVSERVRVNKLQHVRQLRQVQGRKLPATTPSTVCSGDHIRQSVLDGLQQIKALEEPILDQSRSEFQPDGWRQNYLWTFEPTEVQHSDYVIGGRMEDRVVFGGP